MIIGSVDARCLGCETEHTMMVSFENPPVSDKTFDGDCPSCATQTEHELVITDE